MNRIYFQISFAWLTYILSTAWSEGKRKISISAKMNTMTFFLSKWTDLCIKKHTDKAMQNICSNWFSGIYDYFVTYRHILYSILWLRDIFSIFDLQTLLGNGKSVATAKYLWVIRFYTVDPVGAKHITRTNLENIFF